MATPGRAVERLLSLPNVDVLLRATHVDWERSQLLDAPEVIRALLREVGALAQDTDLLHDSGIRLLGKLQVDLSLAAQHQEVTSRFSVDELIARGSNSVALKATVRSVGRTVVLKVLRPGPSHSLEQAIRELGSLEDIPRLVAPTDSFSFPSLTASGDVVQLHCIVFPFVAAQTLDSYLRAHPPITPYFFEAFVRQVGGVLAALEQRGKSHGDLHGANILVTSEVPALEFTIIDPSPGLGSATPYGRRATDLDWFREHLARALSMLQRHLPSISVQKHLGPSLYFTLVRILSDTTATFEESLRLLAVNPQYVRWQHERARFIEAKFERPKPLSLLRWEEIADPAQAVELFEPFPELFRRIRAFGNALVVGARGSGKSTYLAALAYYPGAKKRLVEPHEVFGVLFSCRQGEFKQVSRDFVAFDALGKSRVKHVLILKIIRRVLSTLADASECGDLKDHGDLSAIYDFIALHSPNDARIARTSASPGAALSNLRSGVVRLEELAIRRLFASKDQSSDGSPASLDEGALLRFCEVVRGEFALLSNTRFYFLFDDAGDPNISREMQHVVNDLVTSSNAVFCVKLSAERFSYDLLDSAGRTIEETHDFTSFDIASAYAIESGKDESRAVLKSYFATIMKRRLEHWHYSTSDIVEYLGDQSLRGERRVQPIRELVKGLATNKKGSLYAGWEVVWQIADKTARNLIELVSEIFAHANVHPPAAGAAVTGAGVDFISPRVQDKAIRAVSNRRLRGLEFIPGEIQFQRRRVPLGRHLFLCTTSFGTVSKKYLSGREPTAKSRLDERLAIERNDTASLNAEAQAVLQALVRYGIFDDSALNVAFDDGQKKPVYVFNRIFCPAFGISFRRDAHLRLSTGKLEMYAINPARFVNQGTEFLRKTADAPTDLDLFRGAGDE